METYRGNVAEPLIDNELWAPLLRALDDARSEVLLSQLLFDPGFSPTSRKLEAALMDADARGAKVCILVNENAAIPDSYDELVALFDGTGIEVRALHMTPNVLHAKVLVVDGREAFLLDSPFQARYADSRTHPFDIARRGHHKAHHAVSLRLRGPAVAGVHEGFRTLWEAARANGLETCSPPPPAGRQTVRLAWTNPAGLMTHEAREEVLAEYAAALARAERFVYIENQYFTSPTIAGLISGALERNPRLQVILALNVNMDVPSYDQWLALRLREIGWPHHPRLGVFALWAPRRAGHVAVREVYLHSKTAFVDDTWATIGSANLDSISLHEATEFGPPFPQNVELNAILLDGLDGEPATGLVAALRRRLWGEHLGDEGVWTKDEPEGGWLAVWRKVAEQNLARFEAEDRRLVGKVFPFGALAKDRILPFWKRDEARP